MDVKELCVSVETKIPRLTIAKMNRRVINTIIRKTGQSCGDNIDMLGEASKMIRAIRSEIVKGIKSVI